MSKDKKKKDPVNIVLNIIIFVLVFVMIGIGIQALFYKNLADERRNHTVPVEVMAYRLEKGDYASFIHDKYMNEINDSVKAPEYYALADYMEAALKYRVYDTKGYTGKADEQKTIMDESREKMGSLTVFADKFDMEIMN